MILLTFSAVRLCCSPQKKRSRITVLTSNHSTRPRVPASRRLSVPPAPQCLSIPASRHPSPRCKGFSVHLTSVFLALIERSKRSLVACPPLLVWTGFMGHGIPAREPLMPLACRKSSQRNGTLKIRTPNVASSPYMKPNGEVAKHNSKSDCWVVVDGQAPRPAGRVEEG